MKRSLHAGARAEDPHQEREQAMGSSPLQEGVAASAPYFPWRGWAICVEKADAEGMALFAEAVDAACERAADYGMNLIEFHDYACPGGIVDAVISYRDFPRLDSPLPAAQREAQFSHFKELSAGVKARGLDLNAWYHVFRNAPPDLAERYPDVTNVDRPFVVEMDLYGEYHGRATVPWCHPEYVHRVIRELLPFRPQGVTARILHVTHRPHPHRTVFHSPNDVNLHALGRFLNNPGPQLGPENRWHSDYGHMDAALWLEWATRKYGADAAIPVIRALRRTPRIVELTYDLAGTTYQKHSSYPSPSEAAAAVSQPAFWTAAVNVSLDERLDRVGLEFLRDEKWEALRLARCSLADIREAGSALVPEEYRLLLDLFEGTLLLIRGMIAHLETWAASRVPAGEQPEEVRKAFHAACRRARAVSRAMRRRFGEQFFGGTPDALDRLVDAAKARSCGAEFLTERERKVGGCYA